MLPRVDLCRTLPRRHAQLKIEPSAEQCFFETLAVGDVVDVSVLVYRGGQLNIKLRIVKPDSTVLLERSVFSALDDATAQLLPTIVRKGHKWEVTQEGAYSFCADNRGDSRARKVRPGSAAAAG